jgi:hypothetical protein
MDPADLHDAFNHQPVLLPLAGAAAMVATGAGILGAEGWAAFTRVFAQVVLGAVSPLDQAQVYLRSFQACAGDHGIVAVPGLVCAKVSAVNLLPLATFSGGQAWRTWRNRGGPKWRRKRPELVEPVGQPGVTGGVGGGFGARLCSFANAGAPA